MGQQVRSGMAWTMGLTIIGRGLSLAAQVVLAAIFSAGDWGVFAIFTSIFLVVTCLRHFSLNQLLLQRGPEAFKRLVGPVYWLISVLHWACAGLIAALAWPLAWMYQHDVLMWYMLIGAASLLPGAPAVVYIARLQQQLRFREATIITGVSSVVRFGGQIGLALAGVGPLSFVLPLLATAIVEWAMGWWFVREALWKRAKEAAQWRGLLFDARYLFIGSLATTIVNYSASTLIGAVAPERVTGQFFFAYSIVVQVGVLLSSNAFAVLMPALQRLRNEPMRMADASARAAQMTAVAGCVLCLPLMAVFGPIEAVVWRGKWAETVLAVQVLSLLYPIMIMATVALAVLSAHDRSRAWAAMLLAIGLVGNLGALGAAWTYQSATAAAIGYGTGVVVVALISTAMVYRSHAIALSRAFWPGLTIWLACASVCVGTLWFDQQWLASRAPALLRCIVLGTICGVAMLLVLRLLTPAALREGLTLVPGRLRPLAARALLLA
jgi:O-antigen/teichoic acid export membrane protein